MLSFELQSTNAEEAANYEASQRLPRLNLSTEKRRRRRRKKEPRGRLIKRASGIGWRRPVSAAEKGKVHGQKITTRDKFPKLLTWRRRKKIQVNGNTNREIIKMGGKGKGCCHSGNGPAGFRYSSRRHERGTKGKKVRKLPIENNIPPPLHLYVTHFPR